MPLRWSHAVFYVRDLDAMLDFYTNVLGFEVTDRGPIDPGRRDLELVFLSQVATDHHQLAFLPVRADDAPPNRVDHVAFRTESLHDVRALAERLEKDGRATRVQPINHGNAWSIYFRDPEGNGIEVFCDSPWHVSQPQAKPWELSMSDEELREQTRKQFGEDREFGPIDDYYATRAERIRRE